MRPLVTILEDSLSWYGVDEYGGRVHDLLGTGCDPYINAVLTSGEGNGEPSEHYDFHCRSNLTRAVLPFGLVEHDIHDVINIFQVTGLDEHGRYFMNPCPAGPGDYIEFLAEQDVLMALSMFILPSFPSHEVFLPFSILHGIRLLRSIFFIYLLGIDLAVQTIQPNYRSCPTSRLSVTMPSQG